MRANEDSALFVKPHLAEYVQADCRLTERDKTMGGRYQYLSYDNASFENPLFKKATEGSVSFTSAKPYTLDSLGSS